MILSKPCLAAATTLKASRVWPSEAACEAALADFRALHLSHSLGLADALITAISWKRGAALCTFNVKHFRAVSNLTTEQPYPR